jgi:hypothetical protein
MTENEMAVTSKVEELMEAIDQVNRYRALTRLMVDFAMIMLVSIVGLLTLELGIDFYGLGTSLPCYYNALGTFTCVASVASASTGPLFLAALSFLIIPAAGLLAGITWVDRRLKSVKGGLWKDSLGEGFPGALKLLQEMKWDSVFEDIRLSRIGYATYFAVKVAGYWALAFIGLFFPYVFGIGLIHTSPNVYLLAFFSLILVLVVMRKDLLSRYRQVVSLDNLLWELRWFSSEFRAAKFEA